MFIETCDYFLVGKNDEMRVKSEDFFKFFTRFIDDVMKQMPKPQVVGKKKMQRAGAAGGAHAAMMAEMMARNKKK